MPRRASLARIAGALLLGWATATVCLGGGRSELRFTRWGTEHGLPHNSVYAITQDADGFMWIGTVDGLARFDGYEFRNYGHAPGDRDSLRNQVIRALLVTRDGTLWVGTDAGLDRFLPDAQSFEHVHLPSTAAARGALTVGTLLEDDAGTLWIGTDRGLFRRQDGAYMAVPLPAAPSSGEEILGIQQDRQHRMWFLAMLSGARQTGRLLRHEPLAGTWEARPMPGNWVPGSFAVDRRGRFWCDLSGPRPTDASGFPELTPRHPASWLYGFAEGRDDRVLLGNESGLFRHAGGVLEEMLLEPDDSSWLDRSVRVLYRDRANVIWVGTYAGLYRFDPAAKPFVHWRHDRADPSSLSVNAVSAVLEASDGSLWLGTFGGGLNRIDRPSGRVTRLRHVAGDSESLPNDIVWSLFEERGGRLWVATEGGLASLAPGARRFRYHDLPFPPQVEEADWRRLTFVTADGAGRLWLGSHTGLYSLDPGTGAGRRFSIGSADAGPNHENVESILVDTDGTLWLGTARQGLVHFRPETGKMRQYPLVTPQGLALASEGIWTIQRSPAGALWLGSGSGLSRFDPATERFEHFGVGDGLPGSLVYSIAEDREGRLWLGTNRGLSCFDARLPPGRCFRNYQLADGIGSAEFNRRAALAAKNGRLYFGGVGGLTDFDPAAIRDDLTPPPVALTAIESSRREGTIRHQPATLGRLVLSYRDDALLFTFAALHFADPSRNRYAYKLEGFDREWVDDVGQRTARYTNLPAGEYTFRVRASNPDGVWNDVGLSLPVVVMPAVWETGWFRTLGVVLAAALLYALYRVRVARLLALERLRLRIAGDLHDDLASELAGIAMATDLVARRARLEVAERDQLVSLRDKALGLVDAVRDTVWAVNPEHDSGEALVRRMRRAAAELLGDTPYGFTARSSAGPGALDMATRRALFLIFKELVHNAARHARASRVDLELEQRGRELLLRVADDGVGFDVVGAGHGEGMPGMRRRAAAIGAQLEIASRPQGGTVATVRIRLARSRDGGRARKAARIRQAEP